MANLGTLIVPSANDVRLGVGVDHTTGNCRVPPITKVQTGYVYDASDSLTGTYDPQNPAPDMPLGCVATPTGKSGELFITWTNQAAYDSSMVMVLYSPIADDFFGSGYADGGSLIGDGLTNDVATDLVLFALKPGKNISIGSAIFPGTPHDASVYPDPKAVISNGAHAQPTFGPMGTENTPSAIDPATVDVRNLTLFGWDGSEIGSLLPGGVGPNAPLVIGMTVGNGRVTFTITGDATSDYRCWYSIDKGVTWTSGVMVTTNGAGAGTIVQTGLTNGTVYMFQVRGEA
jgi:hypothetical protein